MRSADRHGADRTDIVLAAFAADAIDLLTGPLRDEIRACGAPGCVLLYVRDHPRRQWCSNACGNRARQARHYRRTHAAAARRRAVGVRRAGRRGRLRPGRAAPASGRPTAPGR